jgi:hypothetical protein
MIVEFPDKLQDTQIESAMDELGDWAERYLEIGLNPVVIIGLMETYKSALTNNLLVDEEE